MNEISQVREPTTRKLSADDLPASPTPMQPEIKDYSAAVLNEEQYLHSAGWRQLIRDLNSPQTETWLPAARAFRERVTALQFAVLDTEDAARRRCARAFVWGIFTGAAAVSLAALAWVYLL